LPDGGIVRTPRRTAIQSNNDVDIFTEPKVKVGQKVKKGDIITGAVGVEKDTYKTGINTLVLFHAMFGYVNEDAVVVSESYADKMCHYSIIDLMIEVKATNKIKWIAPIGMKVKSLDNVVTLWKTAQLDEVNKKLRDQLGALAGLDNEYMGEQYLTVPNNIDEAWVSDVLIQENTKPLIRAKVKTPDYTFARSSKEYIKEYEAAKDRKPIFDRFPEYIASDTLDPIVLDRSKYKMVYTIRIRLIKKTKLMLGSKMTNRYGGKGVVSKIIPDNLMPVMVDELGQKKTVDIVMNPYSTIGRKIPSVFMENSMGLIAYRLHDLVEKYKSTKTGQAKIKPLLMKYYPGRFDNMTTEEIIKKHNSSKIEEVYYFNVGCFSKITPDQVSQWMEELNIQPQSKILMPQTELADLKELQDTLDPEEYKAALKKMTGKFVEVEKPLMCGYMTFLELFKIPYYDEKATSSMFLPDGDINPFKDSPILGHGKYRTTGQMIGEMELTAYLARNAREFIEYSRGDTSKQDAIEFLNNLLGLGITVKNEQGYNMGASSLRSSLGEMKTRFRLKNKK
jgi:DNA-directed RNA polymerase beta subunit